MGIRTDPIACFVGELELAHGIVVRAAIPKPEARRLALAVLFKVCHAATAARARTLQRHQAMPSLDR